MDGLDQKDQSRLKWIEIDWIWSKWIEVDRNELNYIGMDWTDKMDQMG